MTLHEGQVWRRIEGTEEALVLLINDRYVKYRHDRNVNKPPTHTMERWKWNRLFSFVEAVLPAPSLRPHRHHRRTDGDPRRDAGGAPMKCREGCEGERKAWQPSCIKCWLRIPPFLLFKRGMAKTAESIEETTQAIRDWLAADDKRRAE